MSVIETQGWRQGFADAGKVPLNGMGKVEDDRTGNVTVRDCR